VNLRSFKAVSWNADSDDRDWSTGGRGRL
jgi:hypothetical protein